MGKLPSFLRPRYPTAGGLEGPGRRHSTSSTQGTVGVECAVNNKSRDPICRPLSPDRGRIIVYTVWPAHGNLRPLTYYASTENV